MANFHEECYVGACSIKLHLTCGGEITLNVTHDVDSWLNDLGVAIQMHSGQLIQELAINCDWQVRMGPHFHTVYEQLGGDYES